MACPTSNDVQAMSITESVLIPLRAPTRPTDRFVLDPDPFAWPRIKAFKGNAGGGRVAAENRKTIKRRNAPTLSGAAEEFSPVSGNVQTNVSRRYLYYRILFRLDIFRHFPSETTDCICGHPDIFIHTDVIPDKKYKITE